MNRKSFFYNKNIKYFIIVILSIISILFICNKCNILETFGNSDTLDSLDKLDTLDNYKNNLDFDIKDSLILKKGERGLFATKNYEINDIIEICPTLKMNSCEVAESNILNHHFFKANNSNNQNNSLVSLGYCSLINHSQEKQNSSWKVSSDDNTIIMYAIKPIKKGEELYSNYGEGYWKGKIQT